MTTQITNEVQGGTQPPILTQPLFYYQRRGDTYIYFVGRDSKVPIYGK